MSIRNLNVSVRSAIGFGLIGFLDDYDKVSKRSSSGCITLRAL